MVDYYPDPPAQDMDFVTRILQSALDSLMEKTSHGLEESRHAPNVRSKVGIERTLSQSSQCAPNNKQNSSKSLQSSPGVSLQTIPPSDHLDQSSPSSNADNSLNSTKMEKEEGKAYPVADVDDTVGFMTAARAYTSQQASQASAATIEDTVGEQNGFSNASDDIAGDSTVNEFVTASTSDDAYPSNNFLPRNDSGFGDFCNDITNPFVSDFGEDVKAPKASAIGLPGDVAEFVSKNGTIEASPAAAGTSDAAPLEEEENQDRENLATFKTWGTPVARDKPAARVRRIIIKGLPSSWSTPSKVLSLIHGGIIESVSITPSGNAHVLFAEPEACKAFYDKYPNGIDLDKDKRYTVFVEMGEEVDVVSSQLSYNLSVGATRVIRSVGVDMNITMGQLLKISTANNRKVEKILESYVPGEARNITFLFCSIVDAVGFRGLINRDADWEHCNIQYAPDPCEIATEFHAD